MDANGVLLYYRMFGSGKPLVILPRSGHMTFVDQPGMFIKAVEDSLASRQ